MGGLTTRWHPLSSAIQLPGMSCTVGCASQGQSVERSVTVRVSTAVPLYPDGQAPVVDSVRTVSDISASGSAGVRPSQQLVETNSGVPHSMPSAVTVFSRRQISCPVISRS